MTNFDESNYCKWSNQDTGWRLKFVTCASNSIHTFKFRTDCCSAGRFHLFCRTEKKNTIRRPFGGRATWKKEFTKANSKRQAERLVTHDILTFLSLFERHIRMQIYLRPSLHLRWWLKKCQPVAEYRRRLISKLSSFQNLLWFSMTKY